MEKCQLAVTHDGLSCVSEYLCPILNPPMPQSLNKALLHVEDILIGRKADQYSNQNLFLIEHVVSIDAAKTVALSNLWGKGKKVRLIANIEQINTTVDTSNLLSSHRGIPNVIDYLN